MRWEKLLGLHKFVMSNKIGNIFLNRKCNLVEDKFREFNTISSNYILTSNVPMWVDFIPE